MDKKPEFVVTDRRKFNYDGAPRPDAPKEEETSAPVPPPPAPKPAEPVAAEPWPPAVPPQPGKPAAAPAPVPATGYDAEHERTAFGGQKMEFIHLLEMLVQTAMMYAGAMEGGTERRIDVVGLRQMIDLIGVLGEKTKGNLNEQEQQVLTNTLFQLRMTYMEIVNMIEKQAIQKGPGPVGGPRK